MVNMDDQNQAKFNLRWNSYGKVLMEATSKLLTTGQFSDVTLACEGHLVKCHRSILSAFSPNLAQMLENTKSPEAVIYLGNGIKFHQLQTLLTFMYNGEAEVTQAEMSSLLKAAVELNVKGLSGTGDSNGRNDTSTGQEQDNEVIPKMAGATSGYCGFGKVMTTPSILPPPSIPSSSRTTGMGIMRTGSDFGIPGQSTVLNLSGTEEGRSACDETGDEIVNDLSEEIQNAAQNTSTATPSEASSQAANEFENEDGSLVSGAPPKKRRTKRSRKLNPKLMNSLCRKVASGIGGLRRGTKNGRKIWVPNGPAPYGDNMKKALDMILGGGRLSDASNLYQIPQSTLSKYSKNPERLKRSRLYYFE